MQDAEANSAPTSHGSGGYAQNAPGEIDQGSKTSPYTQAHHGVIDQRGIGAEAVPGYDEGASRGYNETHGGGRDQAAASPSVNSSGRPGILKATKVDVHYSANASGSEYYGVNSVHGDNMVRKPANITEILAYTYKVLAKCIHP
jgi:hypothetical protein